MTDIKLIEREEDESTQTAGVASISNAQDEEVMKVYDSLDSVNTVDLAKKEVFATLEAKNLNQVQASSVTDLIDTYIQEKLDTYGDEPVGTIKSYLKADPPNGYLPLDGSTFDSEKYPFLYNQLSTDQLEVAFDEDVEWELNKEQLAGTWMGQPLYRYTFKDDVVRAANSWVGPLVSNTFVEDYDILRVVDAEVAMNHAAAYFHGAACSWNFQINASNQLYAYTTTLASIVEATVPEAMRITDDNAGNFITIFYIKKDWKNANFRYKFIKAVTGFEGESEEASQIINAIDSLKEKVAYHTLPLGSYISVEKNGTNPPVGYLWSDGSKFDTDKYPLLATLLDSDTLPTKYDVDVENIEFMKPYFTGEFINSEPIFGMKFAYTAATTNGAWATLQPAGFTQQYDMKSITDGWVSNGWESTTYVNGSEAVHLLITNTHQLAGWFHGSFAADPTDKAETNPKYITVHYTMNNPDLGLVKFKAIKAVSGMEEESEEADAVTSAITAMKEKVAYSGLPAGTIIDVYDKTGLPPTGYLWCDGNEFDTDKYPILYAKLNDNHTPLKFDLTNDFVDSKEYFTGEFFESRGVYKMIFPISVAIGTNTNYIISPSFQQNYDAYKIVNYNLSNSTHSATAYSYGTTQAGMVSFDTATGNLCYYNGGWARQVSADGTPWYITVYYTKNHEDRSLWTYKAIKALTGIEDGSEEATEVANTVETIKEYAKEYVDSLEIPSKIDAITEWKLLDEYEVGKWINGQTIYRKVFEVPTVSMATNTWYTIFTDNTIGTILNGQIIMDVWRNGTNTNTVYMTQPRMNYTKTTGIFQIVPISDASTARYFYLDYTKAEKTPEFRLGNGTTVVPVPTTDFAYTIEEKTIEIPNPEDESQTIEKETSIVNAVSWEDLEAYWTNESTLASSAIIRSDTSAAIGTNGRYFVSSEDGTLCCTINGATTTAWHMSDLSHADIDNPVTYNAETLYTQIMVGTMRKS